MLLIEVSKVYRLGSTYSLSYQHKASPKVVLIDNLPILLRVVPLDFNSMPKNLSFKCQIHGLFKAAMDSGITHATLQDMFHTVGDVSSGSVQQTPPTTPCILNIHILIMKEPLMCMFFVRRNSPITARPLCSMV